MKKILFIGASGMLGKPVAKELIAAGYDVTVAARKVDKLKELFPGTRSVKVDVISKQSLSDALKGHEIVYLNLPLEQDSKEKDPQPEREGLENIIEMAKQSGIKRIAYLSSIIKDYEGMDGFHWWAFQIKQEAVKKIRNSGIPYSIFYPSAFMETFEGNMVRGNKLFIGSGSVAKLWFIAGSDYGKQVAKALQIAGDKNQEYTIQGLTGYDWNEASSIFIKNYRKPLKLMKAPIALVKFISIFDAKARYGWRIMTALNNYPEKFVSEKTWNELGKPSVSLSEYVAGLS